MELLIKSITILKLLLSLEPGHRNNSNSSINYLISEKTLILRKANYILEYVCKVKPKCSKKQIVDGNPFNDHNHSTERVDHYKN